MAGDVILNLSLALKSNFKLGFLEKRIPLTDVELLGIFNIYSKKNKNKSGFIFLPITRSPIMFFF